MSERVIEIRPNRKQLRFLQAKAKHVAFGGARGGGKSWAIREKSPDISELSVGFIRFLLQSTVS